MKVGKTSPLAEFTRPERLRLFQAWELNLSMEVAKERSKTFKYPLYRVGDNGRWMYVVCTDNTEIPFTKSQMNHYRTAEEWVDSGGKCPVDLRRFHASQTGDSEPQEPEDQGG